MTVSPTSTATSTTSRWRHGGCPTDGTGFLRGDPATGSFIAFWLLDGRVVGTMLGGHEDVRKPLEELVRSAAQVDPAALSDPSVPVASLAGGSTAG